MNERITGKDSMQTAIMKLAGGNPGAINVLIQAVENSPKIDPDCLLGGLGPLLSFDSSNIFEHRIWMLYKDVCKQNLPHTLGLLRANQLGFLSQKDLDHAIDNYGAGIDLIAILGKVKKRLPAFNLDF